jgi:hypothetical protein
MVGVIGAVLADGRVLGRLYVLRVILGVFLLSSLSLMFGIRGAGEHREADNRKYNGSNEIGLLGPNHRLLAGLAG